jgi:hypothetical protein
VKNNFVVRTCKGHLLGGLGAGKRVNKFGSYFFGSNVLEAYFLFFYICTYLIFIKFETEAQMTEPNSPNEEDLKLKMNLKYQIWNNFQHKLR